MSYLERYLAGEHERVWDELVALGAAVRAEPLQSDALAVARETMRRARANIEMLIPRLVRIGYQFGYGWVQPPADELFWWRLRESYLSMLEHAKVQPPILTIGGDVEEQLADRRKTMRRLRGYGAPAVIMQNEERMLAELEGQVGILPLSVRAWYEVGGGVNLVGFHPGWVQLIAEAGRIDARYWERGFDPEAGGHPMQHLEPLQIYPLGGHGPYGTDVLEGGTVWDGTYHLAIMPNEHMAYLEHGQDGFDYEIEVPCAGADVPLLYERHETMFVNYLRICFRWGGFPGWERIETRPERDLAFLTEGLLSL